MIKKDAYYQIIIGGHVGSFIYNEIVSAIKRAMKEMGVSPDEFLRVVTVQDTLGIDLRHDGYAVGLWIGCHDTVADREELERVNELLRLGISFLTVFHSQENFRNEIPKCLHLINGCSVYDVHRIVETLLGLLHMLPSDRRAFISYCRKESAGVARQLFEALAHQGFNVYLDTASTRPGVDFQKTIINRLNEDDVIVLLDTPGINGSKWVREEITWINRFGTGVLQVIWPSVGVANRQITGFCEQYQLNDKQLKKMSPPENRQLRHNILNEIVCRIERLRIRSIQVRHSRIVEQFLAKIESHNNNLPGDFIDYRIGAFQEIWIKKRNNNMAWVRASTRQPNAIHLHQAHKEKKCPPAKWPRKVSKCNKMKLLYDPTDVHDDHVEHLKWLHRYLPIQTLDLNTVSDWLKNL